MPVAKDNFIHSMSDSVQNDSKTEWFNKLAVLFDHTNPVNLYGENIAHLILYATDKTNITSVKKLLSNHFSDSLLVIKEEESTRAKVKASTTTEETEEKEAIAKGKHYHCYITYSKQKDVNIHASFKAKIREMLKNNKANRYMLKPSDSKMKPADFGRPWKFTGYNIITDSNNYDHAHLAQWDVFYNTTDARRNAFFNQTLGSKCLVSITHSNGLKVLNWMSYSTKKRTSKNQKGFVVIDNRRQQQQAA